MLKHKLSPGISKINEFSCQVAFRKQDMETSSQGFKWIPKAPCGMARYNPKVKLKIC
jgi:hypothetical protein